MWSNYNISDIDAL